MKDEVWKDIVDYEELYQISNYGRIFSKERIYTGYSYMAKRATIRRRKGRLLKLCVMNYYYGIVLCKNGVHKTFLIHRLVAKAFINNPTNLPVVNHIDFNMLNNNTENLEWCTQFENIRHTINHGRAKYAKGENAGQSKIKDCEVFDILEMFNNGLSQTEIAKIKNMNQSSICRIINKKTYKHILA